MRAVLSAVITVGLLAGPGIARAGTFDTSGAFSFDPSDIARDGFEVPVGQNGIKLIRAADALEGPTYLNVDTQQQSAVFPFAVPAMDASYQARIFARTNRLVASVNIGYPDDSGSPGFFARFYPTGVVTSDGWYELTTSDFSVQGTRGATASLSVYASGADVDAFEVFPHGTFRSLSACSPPFDSACRSDEICDAGWCRQGAVFVPPLPHPDEQGPLADWFEHRFQYFFGGAYSREHYLPGALATLETMRHATNAYAFWNGLGTAIRRLHDWHTTLGGPVSLPGQGAFPICFVEGDGDLSHNLAPKDPKYYDVLVSSVGPVANSGLKPGDRLVAINGMHPIAFVESLDTVDWGMWRADDPGTHAEAVERMPGVIRRFAHDITVIRCDAGTSTCSAPETIDVASLPPDASNVQYPYCDERPAYHLAQDNPDPVKHDSYKGVAYGLLADSQQGEDAYGMIWNDVWLTDPNQNAYSPAMDEFRQNAQEVILDHRQGNGGTAFAAEYLTELFRPLETLAGGTGFHLTVGEMDPPFTMQVGTALYQLIQGYDPYEVGASDARTNLPTALLLARDGSASDWFPLGMKGSKNVRIFGRPTAGAFSSYIQWDYYANFNWRLASGDLLHPDGASQLGSGVVPDEEIVPEQSDLLVGKDTVYLRALDWVRTCVGCRQ